LEINKKSYQVMGAILREWKKELEAISALVESMEAKAKVWHDKVQAI
jgi:hypothetical protein